jgi:CheY-like chemotaxis protein
MRDKILIVDDDDLVLACFERLLSRQFEVETVTGPYDALEAIRSRGPFAVVLSDLRMPGMNGVQLLEKARELSPHIVGLVLSGNVEPRDVNSPAVHRVLDKPCSTADLVGALTEAIAYHRSLAGNN